MKKLPLVLALLLVAWAGMCPAFAATPAFDSKLTCQHTASASSLTSSSLVIGASKNLFVQVVIITSGGADVSGITWNSSENLSAVSGANRCCAGSLRHTIWYIGNPTATTADVVVTFNVGMLEAWMCPYLATSTNTFGTAVPGDGTMTTPTVTCSSATGQLVVDFTLQYAGTIGNPGSGQTRMGSDYLNNGAYLSGSYEAGASSVVMDWSGTGTNWMNVCVPLIGASATAPSSRRRR